MKKEDQSIKKLKEQLFDQTVEDFARPVTTWYKQKPGKRTAFLLFCDKDAGLWSIHTFCNPRSECPTCTSLNGLHDAMEKSPELFDAVRAHFKCAEHELKKAAKANSQSQQPKE